MKPQTTYHYSILRYVHDVRTEEFINVGVLFHVPESGVLKLRTIQRTDRLSGTFPGVETEEVLHSLKRLSREFGARHELARQTAIESIRRAVLPEDDSSFQWASAGGGLCDDASKALESVYQRYVGRYERKNVRHVRSDADVWNVLRAELSHKHVLGCLHSAKITTPLRPYHFEHAWQNYQLHALKPFSLDATDRNKIAEKASQWVGIMHDLSRSKDQFQLHLVIGAPQQSRLQDAFASARDLLKKCAQDTAAIVHDETDIPQLADQIARDVAPEGNARF
ncbi:MAG: DUF3037 domain-containing protein [Verrucomicrobiota bacterium]